MLLGPAIFQLSSPDFRCLGPTLDVSLECIRALFGSSLCQAKRICSSFLGPYLWMSSRHRFEPLVRVLLATYGKSAELCQHLLAFAQVCPP